MTRSAMHWPTMSPETHFQRRVRCFTQRPRSLHALLDNAVALNPQGTALVCNDTRLTYLALNEQVGRLAAGWHALGLNAGDRVALLLSNRIEFVLCLLAATRLGAITVPLSVREQTPGLHYMLSHCEAVMLVHDAALADVVPAKDTLPALSWQISVGACANTLEFSSLLSDKPYTDVARVNEEDTAVILYTSGTTGRPKGAMLSHLGIVHSCMHFQAGMKMGADSVAIAAVPLSHVTGLVALVTTSLHVAGTLVILPSFKAATFLQVAAKEKMTHSLMVPAMYSLCLLEPSFSAEALKHWRIGGYGGAPMPVAVIEQLAKHLPNLDLRNAYGATETTSPVTLIPAGMNDAHLDSVGRVLPCADVRIMNDAGQEVPFGETGELWINGPMVVPGYWDNPEATAQSFTAGYWHSGDLGCMDKDGFVKIFDRKKDMLNRGGFKIYSVEVENCLMGIPGVLEAAIVGKPCPVLGERVHAFIYAPNQSISQDLVTAHCKQALADYKVPETVTWLDAPLPRNANGKVMKRQLRLNF